MESLDLLCERLLRLEKDWGGEFAIAAFVCPHDEPLRELSVPGLLLQTSITFDITVDPKTGWPIRCSYFFPKPNDSRLRVWLDIAEKCRETTGRHPVEFLINHPIEKSRPKRWVDDFQRFFSSETCETGEYRILNPVSDLRDALIAMQPKESSGRSKKKGGRKSKTKLDELEKRVLQLKEQGFKPSQIDKNLGLDPKRASEIIHNVSRRVKRQNAGQNRPK
jgi:hypothetical protein